MTSRRRWGHYRLVRETPCAMMEIDYLPASSRRTGEMGFPNLAYPVWSKN